MLGSSLQPDIYERFNECKKLLTKSLGKYVRYGEIWDEDSVEGAQFSGNFETFVESAKRMAVISQDRIDYQHWGVSVNGTAIEKSSHWDELFLEGKTFASLDHLLEYIKKVHKIQPRYYEAVLQVVGISQLQYAFNICRSNPVKSEKDVQKILRELEEER